MTMTIEVPISRAQLLEGGWEFVSTFVGSYEVLARARVVQLVCAIAAFGAGGPIPEGKALLLLTVERLDLRNST